jgi:bifunctional non-homologous end joining protein LigD
MDALLVGYYSGSCLMFAGKVRAGIAPHARRQLAGKLKPLHTEQCLFMNLPDAKTSRWGGGVTEDEMREVQWVQPRLVVQIRFVEWTAEGACATPFTSANVPTRWRRTYDARCRNNMVKVAVS